MNTPTSGFTLAEKLAIVHAVDSVIIADGTVHKGELTALGQLMHRIEFDSNFILQARNITHEQSKLILRDMTYEKKKGLAAILDEIAISDGFVHEKETALMTEIYAFIGFEQKMKTAIQVNGASSVQVGVDLDVPQLSVNEEKIIKD